jgi:hypothetical protein
MKLLSTGFLVAAILGGCNVQSDSVVKAKKTAESMAVEKGPGASTEKVPPIKHEFSCTKLDAAANNYRGTIKVFADHATFTQSSDNAEYMPVEYSVELLRAITIPEGEPEFSCSLSKPEEHDYTLRIQLFADRLVVLRSSNRAEYLPLVYSIVKAPAATAE